jgi:predicted RNase H-like nuclease
MNENETKHLWETFEGRTDDRLSNEELRILLKQVQAAIPYLGSRIDIYNLAFHHALQTERELQQRIDARKRLK